MHKSRANIHTRIISQPRLVKKLALVVTDAIALSFALWSAFSLGLSSVKLPAGYIHWSAYLFVSVSGVLIFARLGLYRAVVRHMRSTAVQSVTSGVAFVTITVYLYGQLFLDNPVPLAVTLIFSLSALLYVGGTRLFVRSYYRWIIDRLVDRERVLIYGAGGAGVQLAKLLEAGAEYLPVGFIDDDSHLWGSDVFGLRVYQPDAAEDVIDDLRISSILIALPNVESSVRAEVAQSLARYHVSVKTIPSMPEIISGAAIDRLRDIELEDLLGRVAVQPIEELYGVSLSAKSVCITGAGGSIGSELSRQVLRGGASKLVLVEHSEYALYKIENELTQIRASETCGKAEIIPVLLSVLEKSALQTLLSEHEVHTLYHAAAYKHVPIVEGNPAEGIRNNAFGTKFAAEAALEAGVCRFVLVSTDKAVRPTNVMGASKRLAEMTLQLMAERALCDNRSTIYSMVRFGNVLGSSGSVVPLFKRQIQAGGPVTVTHPKINRYFMTISEAASLVIQAGAMATGGEVFVLDMGEPVRIVDLAERLIRLSGFEVKSTENPTGDIEIVFTGLRPGEKLFEELLIDGDITGTGHPKILRAEEQCMSNEHFQVVMQQLEKAISEQDTGRLISLLEKSINGYKPARNAPHTVGEYSEGRSKVVPLRSTS